MINGKIDQHMSREQNIPEASAFPIFLHFLQQFDSVWPRARPDLTKASLWL